MGCGCARPEPAPTLTVVGTLDARSRTAVNAMIGVLLAWAVASLMLPSADLRSFTFDPVGARIGPMTSLDAVASDRPTTSLDIRRNDGPDVIPAVASIEAGTRAALLWVIRDVRFPMSLVATSPLAAGVTRRGPPLPSDS
jgi:hypothetical protein